MKERSQNSRIKFKNYEIKTIIDSLNHWVEIDIQKFAGKALDKVKPIANFIKLKTVEDKQEYNINLNCEQLIYIHGAVAEEYIDYKSIEKTIAKSICENIENIIKSNYKISYGELVYPSYKL